MDLQLESFDISPNTGFLPQKPSETLPGDNFCEWERAAKSLYHLIKEKKVIQTVNDLPDIEFSFTTLHTKEEWHRAYVIISFIAQAYISETGDTAGVAVILPPKIAIPWHKTAEVIGVKPVATYSAVVLYNYTLKDFDKPFTLDNLETALSFTGSSEESCFFMVHALEEVAAAPGLQAIVTAYKAVTHNDNKSLSECFKVITKALHNMKSVIGEMADCTANFFYYTLRPYLGFPEHGVIFDGVSPDIQVHRSGSGAQDSAIPAFSTFLEIQHKKKEQDDLDDFMLYMPAKHREFLLALREQPSVKAYVQQSGDTELKRCYDAAVDALEAFRSEHIILVTKYIINAKRLHGEETTKNDKGTGSTEFMTFLKNVRDNTKSTKLNETV